MESIIKLNEDVKKEIYNVKKSEECAQKHADRVESIYIKSEKSFSEFLRLKDEMARLDGSLREVTKELTKIRSDTKALVNKSDITSLQKDVHKELDEIREFTKRIDKEKVDAIRKDLDNYRNTFKDKLENISVIQKKFNEWYDVFVDVEDLASKSDILSVQKEMRKFMEKVDVEKIDAIRKDLDNYRNTFKGKPDDKENKGVPDDFTKIDEHLKSLETKVSVGPGAENYGKYVTRPELDKELNDMFKSILEKLDGQKEYIDKKMQKK